MKTTHENSQITTPDFRGIVIDPKTGRKCAICRDIASGLLLTDGQVKTTLPRVYQGRFLDVEDVLAARRATPRVGRPKKQSAGIILSELTAALATALAGAALSATLITAISEGTTPVLREMVDARELISMTRISELENLNMGGSR